jgi:patatin-like phospholipase/acyl hydrolase
MAYCILSFDGGGIRGVYSAAVLEILAAQFPPLLQNVKLFAGTSTGGIIALLLAMGKTPGEIVGFYEQHGPKIFDDSLWDDIVDLGKAVGADYATKPVHKAATAVMGETTLGDLRHRVLIPAFDLDNADAQSRSEPSGGRQDHDPEDPLPAWRTWKPKFFHNFPGTDSDARALCVDVALRTSAAPTYFPSYQGYIDGGVVANNPSMAAIATALDPRCGKQTLEDVVVLSISTGADSRYLAGTSHNWGWGQWARPMVSIMISGVMGVADFQARQLLGNRYRRIDKLFDRPVQMDDAKKTTLQYLQEQAKTTNLAGVIKWLRQNWM